MWVPTFDNLLEDFTHEDGDDPRPDEETVITRPETPTAAPLNTDDIYEGNIDGLISRDEDDQGDIIMRPTPDVPSQFDDAEDDIRAFTRNYPAMRSVLQSVVDDVPSGGDSDIYRIINEAIAEATP